MLGPPSGRSSRFVHLHFLRILPSVAKRQSAPGSSIPTSDLVQMRKYVDTLVLFICGAIPLHPHFSFNWKQSSSHQPKVVDATFFLNVPLLGACPSLCAQLIQFIGFAKHCVHAKPDGEPPHVLNIRMHSRGSRFTHEAQPQQYFGLQAALVCNL